MKENEMVLLCENASYRYEKGAPLAVDDVSFQARKGEFVAILGHNGSGKSTLAKMINALFVPESGRVTVCGIVVGEDTAWDVRRHCGMVFQNPDNQLVANVVEEDVAFGLENLGVESAEIQRRVKEALKSVGMGEYALSAPHMLSGGQKQRVAIAGVLAMKSEMIVFDESTAMLDPRGRQEVLDVVRRLNKEAGVTILWITHFMEEAAMADRVMVMDQGRIAMEGSPRQVFERAQALKDLGLDVPEMAEMAQSLREKGLDLPRGILTVEEMEDALCPSK